ncbi:MAG: hypothetical protein IT173_13330 [Acidobacteria bacterium]|nr:hypothetical protein [Acidobacteriota bacterium]
MTPEFEQMMHDPDLEAERGPGGTLIFVDGSGYCVVGPEFVSVEESDCFAYGETREQAIANYAARTRAENDKER